MGARASGEGREKGSEGADTYDCYIIQAYNYVRATHPTFVTEERRPSKNVTSQ